MSFFVVVAVAGLLSGPVESAYFGGGKQLVVDCAAKSPPSLKVALRSAYQKVEKSSEQSMVGSNDRSGFPTTMIPVGDPGSETRVDDVWKVVRDDACEAGRRQEAVACRTLKFEGHGVSVEIAYSSTPVALAAVFGVAFFLETALVVVIWCRGRRIRLAGPEGLPQVAPVAVPLAPVPRPRSVGIVPAGPRPSAPPPSPPAGSRKASDGDLLFAETEYLKCKKID